METLQTPDAPPRAAQTPGLADIAAPLAQMQQAAAGIAAAVLAMGEVVRRAARALAGVGLRDAIPATPANTPPTGRPSADPASASGAPGMADIASVLEQMRKADEQIAAVAKAMGVSVQQAARAMASVVQEKKQREAQASERSNAAQKANDAAPGRAASLAGNLTGAAAGAARNVLGLADALARVGQVAHGSALAGLGDLFNNVGRVAQGVTGAVAGGFAKIGQAAKAIGGPIGAAVGAVADAMGMVFEIGGKVVGFLLSLPGIAASTLSAVASYVKLFDPAAAMRFDREVDNLGAAIGSMLKPILEAATPLIGKMNEWFTALASTMQGPLTRVMQTVVAGIEIVWDSVRQLGNAFGGLWDTITGGGGAENGFRAFITVMVAQVAVLVDAIRNLIIFMDVVASRLASGKFKTGSFAGDLKAKQAQAAKKPKAGGKTFAAGQSQVRGIDEASKQMQAAALSAGHRTDAEIAVEETAESTKKIAEEAVKQTGVLDRSLKVLDFIAEATGVNLVLRGLGVKAI